MDKRSPLVSIAALIFISAASAALAEDADRLQVTKDAATISVQRDQQSVFDYRYTKTTHKCYVEKLFTPSGRNILRDSPHDHVHHHALMFAVAVDGVDFWAEFPDKQQGKQIHRSEQTFSKQIDSSVQTAGFTAAVDWMPNESTCLMTEQRTIQVFQAKGLEPTLLSWQASFAPAGDRSQVVLSGQHYFGLGIRFIESMDRVGKFCNSAKAEGKVVRGQERLTQAKWVAYTAPADGQVVTVALFDHPQNVRHPATMFTMPAGFAYISATLNLQEEPLTIEAAKPLLLNYGVALWDGEVEPAEIERVYNRWGEFAAP